MKSEVRKNVKVSPAASTKVATKVIADKKNDNTFLLIVLSAYIIIGFIEVFHHEMWRDELQTWLVGASSKSLGEFLNDMKTEDNPYLWYSINFFLSRFTDSPVIAQVFHFLISCGSVYLILKYAPFSKLQKVLLSFSYFVAFEYSILARGYVLTVFFTFLFCSFYQIKSKNRYLILSLILLFQANSTGAHGVILALSLLGMMIVDYYFSEDISLRKKYKSRQFLTGVMVALIGIYIAIKCILPPPGTDRSDTWFFSFDTHRLMFSIDTFWLSFFPIPNFLTVNFWNSNILYASHNSFTFGILILISLAIFLLCTLQYSKKLSVAVFYLSATCGILLFAYSNNVIFQLHAARYYGFLFITFVAASWLSSEIKKTKMYIPGVAQLGNKLKVEKNFTYLVTGLFAINSLGSGVSYFKDYSLTFSNSKKAGNYIMSKNLAKLPETGFIDYAVSPISAYTKQPIYYPDRDTTSRFTMFGNSKFSFDPNVLLSRLMNFVSHQHDSVLCILTGDYFGIGKGRVIGNIQFTPIASFDSAVVPDENYILYIANRFDLNKVMNDSGSFHNLIRVSLILSSGYDLFQKGRVDDAEQIFTTVQEKTYGMAIPHLHNYLGMVYSKKNRISDAEKEFNTEIAFNLQKEEAFFNLGMLYMRFNEADSAIKSWESVISVNPKNVDAYNNLGVCFINFNHDNSKALLCFEKTVELNPNYTQGYINVLICAQNSNNEGVLVKYIKILLNKGMPLIEIKAKGINISDELMTKLR